MAKRTLKILRPSHHKTFNVCLAIFQHYAWKGWSLNFTSLSVVALRRYSWEKVFWKNAANLQENAHTEVTLLQSNFIKITLWHGCSPVNLLHIFRTLFFSEYLWRLLLTNNWFKHFLPIISFLDEYQLRWTKD